MQDYRVVYDPELDPKKKHKLKKSFGRPESVSKIDPRRMVDNYSKLGRGKTKLVREYGPVLFEFDEFSKTGPLPTSILLTTSPKVDQNELLMVIQEIGKLESFSFAKNNQGLLLASVTFGHSSAARDAALKWNGTRVNDHRVVIELDEDCQKFNDRKIKPEESKKVGRPRREVSPASSRRGRHSDVLDTKSRVKEVKRDVYDRDKDGVYCEKRHKSDRYSETSYESRHYRPEKEVYSNFKRGEDKSSAIVVKERKSRDSPKSTLRMIQEEIVSIVERDYHNRIILQFITDFISKSLPPPSIITDNLESVSSLTNISVDTRENVRRTLPSFKKLKSSEPTESASSKLIKKNYKLLSRKKRFYMESDAESASSSSSSDSGTSDSDGDVLQESDGTSREDLMEVELNENVKTEMEDGDLLNESDANEKPHVNEMKPNRESKVLKKSRAQKSVKKRIRRHDPIIYQKPVRIPFDFEAYEERFAIIKAQNVGNAQVPDIDSKFDETVDLKALNLDEMGYDSEDQRIIRHMLEEEVEKRKIMRSKSAPIYGEDGQRLHLTGSARSEGYYTITSAEKKAHLRVVSNRDTTTSPNKVSAPTNIPSEMRIASSRASRFTQRQLVVGPDSKKPPIPIDSAESVRFKQMKNRKRRLKFAKSDIHDWGLFAMERIEANEMIIEYIGEKIRLKIADLRELEYEKQGIGSSYLFRVDDDIVIDATKMGNLARFINHCCEPNCYAKIINIDGTKRIIIYANVDIEEGEEITYDYKFPIEDDKIPCLCGAAVGQVF